MSNVVDLYPARSVEFDDEMEALANRLSVSLAMLQVIISKSKDTSSAHHKRMMRLNDRVISTMSTIQGHMDAIEEEMDLIFSQIRDGEVVSFQTYDEDRHAIVSSELTTRCHTIRVQQIRYREIMVAAHHNDDFGSHAPAYG